MTQFWVGSIAFDGAVPTSGGENSERQRLMRYWDVRVCGAELRRGRFLVRGGELGSLLCSRVSVFATTLECEGESDWRISCVDDSGEMVGGSGMNGLDVGTAYVWSIDVGVPGSSLDGGVCLVDVMLLIVLILARSCIRIIYNI